MISMSPFLDMLRITLLSLVVSKTFIEEKAVDKTTIFDVRGEDPCKDISTYNYVELHVRRMGSAVASVERSSKLKSSFHQAA
jgi:hypothetical protein